MIEEITEKQVLINLGNGRLLFRPKHGDYMVSQTRESVSMWLVSQLLRKGFIERVADRPGIYQLSETGQRLRRIYKEKNYV